MELDATQQEYLQRQRRAMAVQLYSQQLGVAHLRSKAAAGLSGATPVDLTDRGCDRTHASRAQPAAAATPAAVAAAQAKAPELRVVVDTPLDPTAAAAAAADQQLPCKRLHHNQRRRQPVAVELPGFSPPRNAADSKARKAAAAEAMATDSPDRAPPPGWVRVNAGACSL